MIQLNISTQDLSLKNLFENFELYLFILEAVVSLVGAAVLLRLGAVVAEVHCRHRRSEWRQGPGVGVRRHIFAFLKYQLEKICSRLWRFMVFVIVYKSGLRVSAAQNRKCWFNIYRIHWHWLTLWLLGQLWSQVRAWIYDDLDQSHMIPLQSILTVNVKQTSSESTQNFGWHVTWEVSRFAT